MLYKFITVLYKFITVPHKQVWVMPASIFWVHGLYRRGFMATLLLRKHSIRLPSRRTVLIIYEYWWGNPCTSYLSAHNFSWTGLFVFFKWTLDFSACLLLIGLLILYSILFFSISYPNTLLDSISYPKNV